MKRCLIFMAAACALLASFLLGTRMSTVQGEAKPGTGFAAIPGQVGGQDPFGPYEAAQNWPKPISDLPGNQKWTWGAGEGIFAESPNRVFILQRGELPNIPRPKAIALPQLGPNIEFPIGRLPWRDTTSASPPRTLDGPDGKAMNMDTDGSGINGRDFNWENCLVVVDANGNITERWNQYDKDYRRPHSVFINPYDATKAVWIVDDYRHAIFKYTNDGKTLLQTIGVVNEHASDDKHFNRPTFMAWQADSSFYVADGYNNTRVVKFDKDGKYLMAWGEKGTSTAKRSRRPGRTTSTPCTAWPSTPRPSRSSSTTGTITAFRSSTKTASSCGCGPPARRPRTCTWSTWAPTANCGFSIAALRKWCSTTWMATCCTPGAPGATCPEASGACTA